MIAVRDGTPEDARALSEGFAAMGWDRPPSRFMAHLERASDHFRFLVATWQGRVAGHAQLAQDVAGPSEITDLNTLAPFRRRGVASALLARAEALSPRGTTLGVGLTADYAPALRLYLARGYRPDGRGVMRFGRPVPHGTTVPVDDDLTFTLVKEPA